jgi:phytol kinase
VLTLVLSAILALGARWHFFKSLHSVARRTRGSEYFPLAIFLVFVLASGKPWLYVSAVLTLTVADACAALVGVRYGRLRYEVEDGKKSLEGSLACLLATFLAAELPALLMTDRPCLVCTLSALLVAVLVTGFEAISLEGSDNVFVPVAVCVVLDKTISRPLQEVVYLNVSLAGTCVVVGLLTRRSRVFNTGAKIAILLFAYGTWALGSWQWALPILLGFGFYLIQEMAVPLPPERIGNVRVRTVTRVLLPPLVLLVFANSLSQYRFLFGPYLTASLTVLALSLWAYLRHLRPETMWKRLAGTLATVVLAWVVVLPAPWWIQGPSPSALLAAAASCLVACLLDWFWMERRPMRESDEAWGADKMVFPLAAAGIVVCLQALGVVEEWLPA